MSLHDFKSPKANSSKTSLNATRSWYEILDVPPNATPQEIEDAYERAIALIEGRAVGGYLMLDPIAIETARNDVENAYLILSDEQERAHFDKSSSSEGPACCEPNPHSTRAPTPTEKELSPKESTPKSKSFSFLKPTDDASANLDAHITKEPHPTTEPTLDDEPHLPENIDVTEENNAEVMRYPSGLPRAALRILTPTLIPTLTESASQEEPASQQESASQQNNAPKKNRAEGEVQVLFQRHDTDNAIHEMIREQNEINGTVLRELREARGMSIAALSKATKVNKNVLRAIEEHDFDQLPLRVYLRGFLTQVARVLKVDRKRIADGYLSFLERHGGS